MWKDEAPTALNPVEEQEENELVRGAPPQMPSGCLFPSQMPVLGWEKGTCPLGGFSLCLEQTLTLWLLQCVTVALFSEREGAKAPSVLQHLGPCSHSPEPCSLGSSPRKRAWASRAVPHPLPAQPGVSQRSQVSAPQAKGKKHASAGSTCCLASWNRCSRSSPCSRHPGVPCRLSCTCTHSREEGCRD